MTTAYVSGGMTNIPEFNFPMFDAVRDALVHRGVEVRSPADNDRTELLKHGIDDVTQVPGYAEGDVGRYNESIGDTKDLFRWDFNTIVNECDTIVMLPDWERSTGARWERIVAEALNLKVLLAKQGPEGRWYFVEDENQSALSGYLADFGHHGLAVEHFVEDEAVTPVVVPLHEAITELQGRLKHVPGAFHQLEQVRAQLA